MFTVLDPLLEFTYHLLFSWRKFALCIQSLLCMLFLFGWPPCQRSDMTLMEVSQHAYDMIHYISGLFGYFSVCAIYVNLIWYLYLFMLNKFCLSLSLSPLDENVYDNDVIVWQFYIHNHIFYSFPHYVITRYHQNMIKAIHSKNPIMSWKEKCIHGIFVSSSICTATPSPLFRDKYILHCH